MIERLIDTSTLRIALMEFTDQLDGVGNLLLAMASEQVADGDICRTPEWFACQMRQVLVEEKGGSLVGENHSNSG